MLERRTILIRTRWTIVTRVLLASVVGTGGLSVVGGCGDSAKSDGKIQAAPEAAEAAQAASKSISDQMAKKYSGKKNN
jgi:hypothetical protein